MILLRYARQLLLTFILAMSVHCYACDVPSKYLDAFKTLLRTASIPEEEVVLQCIDGDGGNEAEVNKVGDKYFITFDRSFYDRHQMVVFIGAMSHEVGHYIRKDYLTAPNIEKERGADYYCGKLMKMLGFNESDATECIMNSVEGQLYDSKEKRREQIRKGWKETNGTITSYAAANMEIIWMFIKEGFLCVYIDGREVRQRKYLPGIVYDSVTGSTIELMGFRNRRGACGLGRIVNNRTSICYLRNGHRGYILYDQGEVIPTDRCSEEDGRFIEKNDLIVTCWDEKSAAYRRFVLKNYKFAPEQYLFPAFSN